MKASPIRYYKLPAYPTRLQIASRPALLKQNQPPAWSNSKEIAGAAAFLITVGLASCSKDSPKNNPQAAAVVAPVFKHGEGRGEGFLGVGNPPSNISEDDALEIILDELKKNGISCTSKNIKFDGIEIPPPGDKEFEYMAISNQEKTYGKTFILDGFDPLHKVAVKYLSANSFYGEYFNLVLEAKYISNQVRKNGKGVYFGIFYDPAINDVSVHDQESYNKKFDSCLEEHSGIQIPKGKNAEDERYKIEDKLSLEERVNCHFLASRETKQYQESKKQISLQVKDFIDWLKAQGAI